MNQVTNIITLTDKDLLHFNGKEVRIGQYSLVNEAITFLLNQLQSADRASGQAETLVSFAESNQLSKVFELFIKAAKSQKAWLDESYLQHSILCNYPHTHNKDDATFCNCGLTDPQYALREYDKLCKK